MFDAVTFNYVDGQDFFTGCLILYFKTGFQLYFSDNRRKVESYNGIQGLNTWRREYLSTINTDSLINIIITRDVFDIDQKTAAIESLVALREHYLYEYKSKYPTVWPFNTLLSVDEIRLKLHRMFIFGDFYPIGTPYNQNLAPYNDTLREASDLTKSTLLAALIPEVALVLPNLRESYWNEVKVRCWNALAPQKSQREYTELVTADELRKQTKQVLITRHLICYDTLALVVSLLPRE